jgi:ribosomal protein S6--L-glutamate ligase
MLLGRSALETASATVQPSSEFQQGRLDFDVYFRDPPAERLVRRPLRIALLTMEPDNFSNGRLMAAARERGHVIEAVRTLRCYMNINSLASSVHYDGDILPSFDAVIPRIGHTITAYGAAAVRQFAMTGAVCLNSAAGILNSRDKLLAHQLMAQNSLPMPVTAFASSPFDTDDLIAMVGGPPLIVKLLQSTQGKGVVLAENRQAASSVIDAFRNADANFLVQEFVADAAGQDIRCLVLDGKVIAAMRREACPGDFRSNLHRGGAAHKVKITPEEKRIAIKATRCMGLKFAGVDILRSAKGPLLLEVNSSPGLEGVTTVTGLDIAGKVIEYIESRTFEPRCHARRHAAAALAALARN